MTTKEASRGHPNEFERMLTANFPFVPVLVGAAPKQLLVHSETGGDFIVNCGQTASEPKISSAEVRSHGLSCPCGSHK